MPSFNQLLARLSDMFGSGAGAVPFANRNFFIDGAFDSWGGNTPTLQATSAVYASTLWLGMCGTGGAGTVGINNIYATANAAFMDSGPTASYAHTQTVASTGSFAGLNLPAIFHKVEGVHKIAGRSVTLSGKIWVASGSATIPGALASQNFGSGGSPSPTVNFHKAINWNVTTTPKRFSVRLDVPSITGMSLGTNGNHFTNVGLWLPASWTGTMYFAEMQLEYSNPNSSSDINGNGGAPTAFEYRGLQTEAERISRHWQYVGVPFMSLYAPGASWNIGQIVTYNYPMRTTPAFTVNAGGTLTNASAGPLTNTSAPNAVGVYVTASAAGVCGITNASLVADCRL